MPAMPGNAGHPLCPVASFSKNIAKLNPAIPDLWQRPKTKFDTNDQVWYTAQKIGENKLRKFLSTLKKVRAEHCLYKSFSACDRNNDFVQKPVSNETNNVRFRT